MSTIACSHCGAANPASARFCGRCGTSLQVAAAPLSAPGVTAPPVSNAAPAAAMAACPRCGTPHLATARFCGRCGQQFGLAVAAAPALALAPATYPAASWAQAAQATPHKTGQRTPWAALIGSLVVAMVALVIASQLITPHPKPCGASCPPPPPPRPPVSPLSPSGPPLPPSAQYTSSAYGYSLAYSNDLLGAPSANDAQSVTWSNQDGSSYITFQGELANGRTPQQIVDALQQSKLSGAQTVFTIPGAELGYIAGYGNIYDQVLSPQGGQQLEDRAVIEVAIRNGVAVELIAVSPLTADQGAHAMPAELSPFVEGQADDMGNTVTWQGESPL